MLDIDRNINSLIYNRVNVNNDEIHFIKDSLSVDINLSNAIWKLQGV